MLVVQVNRIHAKFRERSSALLLHKLGIPTHARRANAEFGRQKYVVALASALEPLADEFFRVSVDPRAVPECATLRVGRVQNLRTREFSSTEALVKQQTLNRSSSGSTAP